MGSSWQLCVQGIEEGSIQEMPDTKFDSGVLDEKSGCHCASAMHGISGEGFKLSSSCTLTPVSADPGFRAERG